MSTSQAPRPPRSGIGRLVVVAAVGAGAVLGYQALTGGGGPARPAAIGTTAAGGATLAGAARPAGQVTTGAPPRVQAGGAVGQAATTPTRAALITGPRLVVVVDQPSGPFAEQNRLIMQGATVGLADLNAAGGLTHRWVTLVPERLDGLSPAAVQQRLRAAGRGAVLMLPCDANSQFTIAAGAARYGTLMLAPCDADAALAARLKTYWPVGTAGNDEAAGLAGIMQRTGFPRVFVVDTRGSTYGTLMTRYFREAVAAKHLLVAGSATVSMALTDAELKRVAARIRAAGPLTRLVFSALPPPVVDRLAAGLAHLGLHTLLYGTSAMDTPSTLKTRSPATENATLASYGFLRQDPATDRFVSAYRARFGIPVGSFPGLGFETIRLLEAAVTKAGSTDPSAIQRALVSGLSVPGVALADRSYRTGADHNPVGVVSVEKIASGKFLPLLTSVPSDVPKA